MKKKICTVRTIRWLLLLAATTAPAAPPLVLHNKGGMRVATPGKMYVSGGIHVSGSSVAISQNGLTALTGDFMHDASGNVFTTDYSGSVSGTLEFRGKTEQTVTTNLGVYSPAQSGSSSGKMDKGTMYLKFPVFMVNNGSRVTVTPGMGVTANSLVLANGNLRLKSDLNGTGGLDQDASLLVRQPVGDYSNGYMEIERSVKYTLGTVAGTNNFKFFGFSAPLSNMYLDYFTDHWVFDPRTGKYNPLRQDRFSPGLGYYVVVRETTNPLAPKDYINDNLVIERENFVFERKYYPDFKDGYWYASIPAEDKPNPQEVLNTEDVSPAGGLIVGDNYFGNPYTCALDIDALFDYWGNDIKPTIWIWAGQAGNFLTVTKDISTAMDGDRKVIPTQQMFVVEGVNTKADFRIPQSARVHNAHRFLRNGQSPQNELLVEVRDPELDNYARMAIGLRPWGKETGDDESDARFIKSDDPYVPQVYAVINPVNPVNPVGMDTLSINSLPMETQQTDFEFLPAQIDGERKYTIHVTRQEGLQTEAAILIDKFTKREVNLFETDTYEFTADKTDNTNRFRIAFVPAGPNVLDDATMNPRQAYVAKQTLYITNNTENNLNGTVEIFNVAGISVFKDRITQRGTNTYPLNLPEGVYIVKSGELVRKIKN